MSSPDFVKFSIQITVMLAVAVLFGQIMRRFHQPTVLGEMIGGILLGPTLVGAAFPTFYSWLFNSSESVTVLREATIKLGMLFFLFIAGLEVDLSELRRTGRRAAVIGTVGTLLPILVGVLLVYILPRKIWGPAVQPHFFSFALFIGMNLANSANPVIARVLMDLGLLKGEIGSLIMTATVVDDLINWTLFALILSDIAPSGSAGALPLPAMALLVFAFFIAVLVVGRRFGPPMLRWARQRIAWPTGFIAITALTILVLGSISESLGIHAFLGAFLAGAALAGSDREHHEAHEVIAVFVLGFFAPIYFVSMGMTANFVSHFDALLVSLILVAAYVSKIGAVLIGARLAGMRQKREIWAIGFGLNARGATGIILAGIGLAYKVIDERIFVAIAIMALVTSLTAGPALNALLPPRNLEIPAGVKGIPE